jgi:hypothetical protein
MDEPAASLGSSGLPVPSCDPAASKSEMPELEVQNSTGALGNQQEGEADDSVPASPITVNTMQQLLKRPFADVLKEITATMQVCHACLPSSKHSLCDESMAWTATHLQ